MEPKGEVMCDIACEKKVSLIIPVYNGEKYLHRCLDSVVAQTLQEVEILIIDDHSSDGSVDIVKEYASKDSRIKAIYKQSNGGISETRNHGIAMATGEYIAFCDHDDIMEPQMLEKMYDQAKKTDSDVVQCRYSVNKGEWQRHFFTQGTFLQDHQIREQIFSLLIGPTTYEEIPRALTHYTVWCCIYRRALLQSHNIRFISRKMVEGEDANFNLQVYAYARTYAYMEEELYHWMQNESSVSAKRSTDWLSRVLGEYRWKKTFIQENSALLNAIEGKKRNNAWLALNLAYAIFFSVRLATTYGDFKTTIEPYLDQEEVVLAFRELPPVQYDRKRNIFIYLLKRKKLRTIFLASQIFSSLKSCRNIIRKPEK